MELTPKQWDELKCIAEQETGIFGPIEASRIYKPSLRVLAREELVKRYSGRRRTVPFVVLTRKGWSVLFGQDPAFVFTAAKNIDSGWASA